MVAKGNPYKIEYYVASTPKHDGITTKLAIVFLTDIFGLGISNPKIMADTLLEALRPSLPSGTALDIFIPDYMNGTRVPVSKLADAVPDSPGGGPTSIYGKLTTFLPLVTLLPTLVSSRDL